MAKNQALDRMQNFTVQLWIAFACAVLVAVLVGLLSLAAPFLGLVAGLAGVLANFLLLGAIVASIMVRHAEVVAETGALAPAVAAPVAPSGAIGATPSAELKSPELGEPTDAILDSAEPLAATALTGPVDFSNYSAGDITVVTRRLKLLSEAQRQLWDSAGRPSLVAWDGDDFDAWIAAR